MTHISFAPRIALAVALLAAVLAFALTADAAHAVTLCHEGFKIQ